MTLRRVTFSGRLGQQNEGERNMIILKGLLYMCLDIVITLGVSMFLFYAFVKTAVSPHENDFPCNDLDIHKPFKPNTVGLKHLLFVSLGSPFFLILVVEGLIFLRAEGSNKLAKFFTTSTLVYLRFLLLYALCTFTMEFLKCHFGRLRPHFVAVCQPDWTKMDCSTDPNAVIPGSEIFCLNPDTHRVRTARTSFPSGHTAAAVFAWLFYTMYLVRMTRFTGLKELATLRNVILPLITLWSGFTAITRITDCWHHPTDVLGGVVLALVSFVPFCWDSWSSEKNIYDDRGIEKKKALKSD